MKRTLGPLSGAIIAVLGVLLAVFIAIAPIKNLDSQNWLSIMFVICCWVSIQGLKAIVAALKVDR